MRRLDRYVIREILGPTSLGFLVYTSILLIQFLFRSADMIIRRGLPASDVGQLVLFTLPNIVVLTIPMAFLFGILVAVGRLAADSELIAMRSCGVSLFSLYRPVFFLSLALTAVNLYLMIDLLPRGNAALQQKRIAILAQSVSRQVEPRVFYEEWEGLILYVFGRDPGDDRWRGVFLSEDVPGQRNQITVAETGQVVVDPTGERVVLRMTNAITHEVDVERPDRYTTKQWEYLEQVLEDRFTTNERTRVQASQGLRELMVPELLERMRDPKLSESLRRLAEVEVHKKFSIPVACVVFGLLALPLGFNNRRGGKSSGFALSILVILVYYVLISNGENAARVGKLAPWLAMWLPNFLLSSIGGLLLLRRNRDKSLVLSRLDHWLRTTVPGWFSRTRDRREQRRRHRQREKRDARGRTTAVVVRLPRLRLRFPNLLDRYVIRSFVQVFLLVTVSAVSIYVISDLTESVDDILKNHVALGVVFAYYKYLSLQIFFDTSPILVLIATLIAFALLSRSNEVTAAKSLGVSLYRLSVPAVAAAIVVALFCGFLETFVLPASNARVAELKDEISGRESRHTYRRADQNWLFGQGRYIYNYRHYDSDLQEITGLQVFEFSEGFAIQRRLYASRARYIDGHWVYADGWALGFDGLRQTTSASFDTPVLGDYPETPDYFEAEIRGPEQMTFLELRDYIAEVVGRGQKVPELEVELHKKIAYPVIAVVMALVALPFAFRLGRRGALYGVGVAVVLGMILMGIFAFFTKMGAAGALPPSLAVWSPGVAFSILSLYLFLGIRT